MNEAEQRFLRSSSTCSNYARLRINSNAKEELLRGRNLHDQMRVSAQNVARLLLGCFRSKSTQLVSARIPKLSANIHMHVGLRHVGPAWPKFRANLNSPTLTCCCQGILVYFKELLMFSSAFTNDLRGPVEFKIQNKTVPMLWISVPLS